MQIFVRGDCSRAYDVCPDASVAELMEAIQARQGIPASEQCLVWGRAQLPHSSTLRAAGVPPSATLRLTGRLRGGAAVTVRPRVQRERWSLYWKETMATQTQMVEEVRLEVDPAATTGAQLLALVAERLRWPPVAELMALEGFDGPWERLLLQGRELDLEKLLAEQGVGSGAELTSIRIALAAEGWKIQANEDGLTSSSDEDEAAWEQAHPPAKR